MAEIVSKAEANVTAVEWWNNVKNPEQVIVVNWENQNGAWWNETCAQVLEIFGLPGQRFYYSPKTDYMTFTFKTIQDAHLCRILLSDRI